VADASKSTDDSTPASSGSPAESSSTPSEEKAAPAKPKSADKTPKRAADKSGDRRRDKSAAAKVKTGADAVRARVASLIWLVAVLCALTLAVGALVVALKMNQDNGIVSFITSAAHKIDFGDFKKFTGSGSAVKGALVNWGIAAVIYLVVGKVLDRIIRP
jgi:hypothetical protein